MGRIVAKEVLLGEGNWPKSWRVCTTKLSKILEGSHSGPALWGGTSPNILERFAKRPSLGSQATYEDGPGQTRRLDDRLFPWNNLNWPILRAGACRLLPWRGFNETIGR